MTYLDDPDVSIRRSSAAAAAQVLQSHVAKHSKLQGGVPLNGHYMPVTNVSPVYSEMTCSGAVLCCAALCCAALCCAVLCCAALRCAVLPSPAPFQASMTCNLPLWGLCRYQTMVTSTRPSPGYMAQCSSRGWQRQRNISQS